MRPLCQVLRVAPSAYYAWLRRRRQRPRSTAPNRVWVGDITYLPRQGGGWLRLTVWLDRCSCKIVGWDMCDTIYEDLVSEALRRPPARLVVHSDRGS